MSDPRYPDEHPEPEEYETVYETSESDVLPILKSALESANIPFLTKGEGLINLFPIEALGPVFHRGSGEVEICVPKSRAAEARELLEQGVQVENPAEMEEDEYGDDEDS